MTSHNTDTIERELDSLDRQIADQKRLLWYEVIVYKNDEAIAGIGQTIHELRVKRIRLQHALSTLVAAENGT